MRFRVYISPVGNRRCATGDNGSPLELGMKKWTGCGDGSPYVLAGLLESQSSLLSIKRMATCISVNFKYSNRFNPMVNEISVFLVHESAA